MRKNLFIAAMSILAIAGCSKNEVVENQNPNNIINFKPYVANSTKAVDATTAKLQESGFNVYAWYNTGVATSAITSDFRPNFMDNITVEYNGGTWSYSPEKYWPATGTLDFIAVGNNAQYTFTKDASPAIEFTAATDPTQQTDLVVSTEHVAKESTDAAINFTLKHILSKIDVKVTNTSDLTLDVSSIKFTSILPTATYDLVAGTWGTATGNTTDNAITIKSGLTFTKNTPVPMHESNGGLIIIPQNATGIAIEYQFKQGDNIVDDCTGDKVKTITLTEAFATGKYYTYTLSLTPNAKKITLGASVEEWGTPIEK